jgi:hypothetical protein
MRVQSPAEYSITKYQEQYNALKEASDKVFQEGLAVKSDIVEFYRKLEEIKYYNRKKDIITKDKVDVIV